MIRTIFKIRCIILSFLLSFLMGCSNNDAANLKDLIAAKWDSVEIRINGKTWKTDKNLEGRIREILKNNFTNKPSSKKFTRVFELKIALQKERVILIRFSSHSWSFADASETYQVTSSKDFYDDLFFLCVGNSESDVIK